MTRTQIINYLISKYGYKTYLEIGVDIPSLNYEQIKCELRVGVDPNGSTTFTGFSDDFFKLNKFTYDIVFIDGDHREDQVSRDIENSLRCLNKNGTIVLHDCLPINEQHQTTPYTPGSIWAGTVWKSLAKIRINRDDLDLKIVDTDWGVGILRHGKSEKYKVNHNYELNYQFYQNNREQIFSLINPDQFKVIYNGQ
jgi:hypothetical protein